MWNTSDYIWKHDNKIKMNVLLPAFRYQTWQTHESENVGIL